jgi:23S rRNA (cytidine1920-2'-O)/16S rRNA (cytidine1409-2'-O)-methyltransferase
MKKRADILVFEKGLAKSRSEAQSLIKAGQIELTGRKILKSSEEIEETADLVLVGEKNPFVGRGGLKLAGAIAEFEITVTDLVAVDIGASTGGFTDCLLQKGAKKVYAIDVGTGQLDKKLLTDPRVVVMEKTDIRKVSSLSEPADLAVIDVSFISLELVLERAQDLIRDGGKIITLVKPQFETGPNDKNKSGIVKNSELQKQALEKVKKFCEKISLKVLKEIESPILGGDGNLEYFLLLEK